jgi:hypothetical protein
MGVEVRVAQRLKPSKHRVDRSFLCDERVLGSGALAHLNASRVAFSAVLSFALVGLHIQ